MSLGRRLPERARFARVEELFALDAEERERLELWSPSPLVAPDSISAWMPLVLLLRYPLPPGAASLAYAPSSMVVIVREQQA